jgi:ring-1,2-phenylacetyl-CoA epoxidase subunit PaaD
VSTSTRSTVRPDLAEVWDAVGGVPDPELPPVSLAMLGMVHDVRVDDDGAVAVELLPTWSGCPATDVIGEDVRAAVGAVPGVTSVSVRFRHDPVWTADRITDEGHEALRSFGIAPPAGRSRLPLLPTAAAPSVEAARPCPYCGSTETERDGLFGPTPCRDVRFCRACQQPFEAFKS